jgi:hypothetical protein
LDGEARGLFNVVVNQSRDDPVTCAAMATKKTATEKTATKKSPAKKTAKVSAAKGMPVDAWVAKHATGWKADVVARIFELVRGAAPGATASIKWNQPVFESAGPLGFVRVARAHVTLGFWRGGELKDPKGLLEGSGSRMAHVKIREGEALDGKSITAFVKEAVKLNKAKGDPTKR